MRFRAAVPISAGGARDWAAGIVLGFAYSFAVVWACIGVYFGGRFAGAIDVVGYSRVHGAQQGMSSWDLMSFNLTTPVWVEPGDTIVAHYDLVADDGGLWFRLWGLFRVGNFGVGTAGPGTGEVRITVDRAGFVVPRASATSTAGAPPSETCRRMWRENMLQMMTIGSSQCMVYDVRGTVTWRFEPGAGRR